MSWWGRLWGSTNLDPKRDSADDFWYEDLPYRAEAGEAVTPTRAMQIPAVVDALDAVTDPLSHLPLKVFRRTGPNDEDKEPAPDHPASRLLASPSVDGLTRYEFRGQQQWDLALHGNAYAEWMFGDDGAEGWRLHPADLVTVKRSLGRVTYWVNDQVEERNRSVAADMMWHMRTVPLDRDRLCGLSPVYLNSETLSRALAVQAYGARFFRNDGQAGGVIEFPTGHSFKTPEDRERWRAAWGRFRRQKAQHSDGILEHGAKYNRQQLDNEKSQFVETEQHMAIQVARIWHVPPHKIRSLERATHSNIEQQAIEFVTDTLLGWLALHQDSLKQDVIDPMTEARRLNGEYFAEYNVAGLLRGDLLSRYQAFAMGRQWGWLSVNDVLRADGKSSIGPEGDVRLQPMNMQPLGSEPVASERGRGMPSDPSGSQSE